MSSKGNIFKIGALLGLLSLIQEPLLINLQLLIFKKELLPYYDISFNLFGFILPYLASLFLISKYKYFQTFQWWFGFFVMIVPYLILKYLGVFWDITNYIIADFEGRHIGGGAAMGHVFLLLYLCGPAQFFSYAGFTASKKFLGK